MTREEFARGMKILVETYPGHPAGSNWPNLRVEAFFKAFSRFPDGVFYRAVNDYAVNNFHPPRIQDLRAISSVPETVVNENGTHRNDVLNPDVPNAAELAAKYAPEIRASVRKIGGHLPYDEKERIE